MGSDRRRRGRFGGGWRFNSRSRMGSDLADGAGVGHLHVSIHAPAWGATGPSARRSTTAPVSIHAPAWGATDTDPAIRERGDSFNSRSRMGSDLRLVDWSFDFRRFNSRSRMGSDLPLSNCRSNASVSIHAPAWGATRRGEGLDVVRHVSIHAPAWGATAVGLHEAVQLRFQFTLPHGERPSRPVPSCTAALFQFTLPHGERRAIRKEVYNGAGFQFTLPHGERRAPLATAPSGTSSFNSRSRMGSDIIACTSFEAWQ